MSRRLKIIFVTNNYTPYSGGVVSSIQAFVIELQRNGHEVFVITLDFLGGNHTDPEYIFRLPCPIKFLYKKNHMAIPVRSRHNMKELIDKINPDIIHSHHPFLLGKTAMKIAEKNLIPLVFTHHSLYEHWYHVVPAPAYITCPLIRSYVKKYCNQVAGIIAPSSMVKEYLIECGVDRSIEVLPSGLQRIFEPALKFKEKIKCENSPIQLLSVGRFSPEKNIPFLLDLMVELSKKEKRKYVLTLVGFGPLWKKMQEYAYTKLDLSPKIVRFIHKPAKEKLVSLYHDADLFIFSSQSDTQGLVLAEAMAGATPVIALDGAGQRDIIECGKNGYIVEDMPGMIKCIKGISSCSGQLKNLSYNAWKTSRRYKITNVTNGLVEFYNRFV